MRTARGHRIMSNAKAIRLARGRTMATAQVYAGISMQMARRIEAGDTRVPLCEVLQYAYSLGVAPTALYPGLRHPPKEEVHFDVTHGQEQKKRIQKQKQAREGFEGLRRTVSGSPP